VDAESVAAVLGRLELMAQAEAAAATAMAAAAPVQLSFSQLHQFEVCPVRYRFSQVWRVPAPPDELLPPAAGEGSTELGRAVHEALAAHHQGGGDLLRLYSGPPDGEEMLRRCLRLSATLRRQSNAVRAEVTLRAEGAGHRVPTGFVDRHLLLVVEGLDEAGEDVPAHRAPVSTPVGAVMGSEPPIRSGRGTFRVWAASPALSSDLRHTGSWPRRSGSWTRRSPGSRRASWPAPRAP